MRHVRLLTLLVLSSAVHAQQPFSLQQVLSAPYASQLTAAPTSNLFAWVEDTEGRHNLYVGGKDMPARALTHNTEDDGQDITQLAWAPDGSTIAYAYGAPNGADGKPANPAHLQRATPVQVIVQPLAPESKPRVIGEGRAPLFTHDGDSLLFVREGQIWIACLQHCQADGVSAHPLVFDRGSASSLTLSSDDNTLAFISRRREVNEPSHSLLALFDLRTRALSFPAPSTGDDSAPAFSPDGKQLAWLRAPFTDVPEFANPRVSPTPWSIQILEIATNATRTAYRPEPNRPGSVMADPSSGTPRLLFASAHRLVFFTEADGYLHLAALDPAKNLPPYILTKGAFEADQVTFDHTTHSLYFTSNFDGYDKLDVDRSHILSYLLPAEDEEELGMAQATRGEGIETYPAASADALAALVSDARQPMHPALIAKDGAITLLHPGATPAEYPAVMLVKPAQALFRSSDGIQLHGQLFLPRQRGAKHPALIFVHGGPHRQMLLGYPAMDYYSNAYAMNQYLVSRGFIILSVNYRCGIGYGLEFRQCEHAGATGGQEYNDVLAAQKYLASRPDVDPARIGIWGGSYGGYLTALALSRNSDLFAAGVDFHGVHDWNLEDNAGDWKRGTFAQQDAIGAKALESSPMADLSRWRSPILLIHGDNDPNVAYAQTPLLADALRARNAALPKAQQIDVEELVFPDEVHEFLLHKDWLAAYTAAAAFFERVLKP